MIASDEQLLTLNQARRLPWLPKRGGKAPDLCTMYRWARKGVKGIRLEVTAGPSGLLTTEAALRAFFNHISQQRNVSPLANPRREAEVDQVQARVMAELAPRRPRRQLV